MADVCCSVEMARRTAVTMPSLSVSLLLSFVILSVSFYYCHLWCSHPTIRAFGSYLRLRCPYYGHLKL